VPLGVTAILCIKMHFNLTTIYNVQRQSMTHEGYVPGCEDLNTRGYLGPISPTQSDRIYLSRQLINLS
jgi:hypothetical protein